MPTSNISFQLHALRPKKTVTFLKSKGDEGISDAAAAEDETNKSSSFQASDGEAAVASATDAATVPEKRSWLSRLTSKGADSGAAVSKQEETATATAAVQASDKNRPKSRACSIL